MVVFAVVYVFGIVHTNDYLISPGNATPLAPLVKIHGVATNPRHDKIMLADVFEQQLTFLGWIATHFESHVQIITANQLVEPGIPLDELSAQGYLQMSDAKQAAEAAAFRAVGWPVPATRTGTIVTGVVASSPASSAGVNVGDEIVAVDTTTIRSSCQLIGYVHRLAPRTPLTLRVRPVKISKVGVLTYGAPTNVKLATTKAPASSVGSGCRGVTGHDRSYLGVSIEDGFSYRLPATVTINTANIGGPSAGLAMTLTLINELSRGSLTGHHVIAVTGTVDAQGSVGPVGGVEEKAVAVHHAGASYFFVPDSGGDVAAARDAHQPGLKIIPVTTLQQVLRELRSLGGAKVQPFTKPT
ncbi:MAG TPA: S16 family serine protease [Acidimicrobiales bacterium]|nr:S16 family serine protease [Acidimicrobiales bacterium]